MKIGKRGSLLVMALVLGLAIHGYIQVQRKLDLGFAGPCLLVSTDPATGNQAHFLEQGFTDRDVFFCVIPTSSSEAAPRCIANMFDCPKHEFENAVWSRDGSVIACRSPVGTETSEPQTKQEARNVTGYPFPPRNYIYAYLYAYDFREDKSYGPKHDARNSQDEWEANSQAIEKLLDSRGGPGKSITLDDIRRSEQKLDWTQWQVYQRAIREKHHSRSTATSKALPRRP